MSTSSQLVNVAVSEGVEEDEPHTVFTLGFYSLSKDFEGLWSCEVFHPSGISLNKDTFHLEIHGIYHLGSYVEMIVMCNCFFFYFSNIVNFLIHKHSL